MAIVLKLMIICLNVVYFFLKILPTKNKILFMSRQSNKSSIDFVLINEKISKKYNTIFLCKTLDGKENAKFSTMIKYGLHMFKQMYHLATAKVCILDSYIPTISILKHKKILTIIQMWHSNGTMKKFGYSSLNKAEGNNYKYINILKMHKNYDIVFASSEAYKEHLVKGFNISKEKILTYSLPRIDLLSDKQYEKQIRNKIFKEYPNLESKKKNIIYAPTFRKDESEFKKHIIDLIENIDFSKYNLVIKLHPLSKIHLENIKNVIIDNKFSSFDMLFIADILISDYSCIIYEAGIRNIKLYFYAYDLEEYEKNRGLALDYNELPGYTFKTGKELSEVLEKKYDKIYLKHFINKYVENSTKCTEKIVKLIEEKMK